MGSAWAIGRFASMALPARRSERPALPPQGHWQRLEVETPENVVLDYEVAGFGSRLLAALADGAILLTVLVLMWLIGALIIGLTGLGGPLMIVVTVALFWGYFVFFEGLYQGRTPGKRWMGIRVIRDTGQPIGLAEAALRNLLRVADYLPPPFILGLSLIAFHPKAKRLGDLVAGTVVVRDRPVEGIGVIKGPALPQAATFEGSPELSDPEFRVLEQFLARAPTLEASVRARLADRLVARFASHIGAGLTGEPALHNLFVMETARRESRFGARSGGGGVAERFVVAKRDRWQEFQAMATAAADRGLDRFGPEELIEFAGRYREVAADLARARTYRVQPAALVPLERAVASGHNALYRDERGSWSRFWRFVGTDCPAAVIDARRTVLLAFLAFLVPALLGFGLLRNRPEIAPQVLPDAILARAEAGAARRQEGRGYAEAEGAARPLLAATIIANNVQVAFFSFAGGIFLGVGSLVLLAYNGLSIGAATGHFANVGLAGYLWTFIAGHGLLELFAIWLSGAAGFQLGFAILNPGELYRRDALVLAGRSAIRLVTFAVVLLLVAGLVEGLISASDVPAPVKWAVSGASALLLGVYLLSGRKTVPLAAVITGSRAP